MPTEECLTTLLRYLVTNQQHWPSILQRYCRCLRYTRRRYNVIQPESETSSEKYDLLPSLSSLFDHFVLALDCVALSVHIL